MYIRCFIVKLNRFDLHLVYCKKQQQQRRCMYSVRHTRGIAFRLLRGH